MASQLPDDKVRSREIVGFCFINRVDSLVGFDKPQQFIRRKKINLRLAQKNEMKTTTIWKSGH
ncbi:MAG: hypothetical protein ACXVBF_14505, partial [Flavisolibacter sp.]